MEREGHIMLNCPKCEAPCRAEDEHCGRCGQSLTADVVEDPITLRDAGLLRGISAPADGGPAITTGDIGSIPEGIRTGGTGGANVAMGDVGYVGSVNINISPEAIASLLEGQRRLFQGSLETISGNSGTVANRFELREIIGRSGMGRTYRALDTWHRGAAVCLKIMPDYISSDAFFRSRFTEAASCARGLAHTGIVEVLDVSEVDDPVMWVAMEFVDGLSLEQVAVEKQGQRLAVRELWPLINAVTSALAYMHDRSAPVFHRGLMPSNILVNREGIVKVTDFATSAVAHAAAERLLQDDTVGNGPPPAHLANYVDSARVYEAPEAGGQGRVGPESDQFSLAVVVGECLVGKDAASVGSLLSEMSDALDPMNTVEDRARRAIETALLEDPTQRWPDLQQFCNAFRGRTAAPPGRRGELGTGARSLLTGTGNEDDSPKSASGFDRYQKGKPQSTGSIMSSDWHEIREFRDQAVEHMSAGRWSDAAAAWREVLQRDKRHSEATRELDICNRHVG